MMDSGRTLWMMEAASDQVAVALERDWRTMPSNHHPDGLPPGVSRSASWDAKLRLGLAALGLVLVVVVVIYWIAPI